MRKLSIILGTVLALATVLAVSCGGAAPAPTATVTVTKTAAAAPASTVTVTTTSSPVTVTATPTPTPVKLVEIKDSEGAGGIGLLFAAVGIEKGLFKQRGIDYKALEMTVDAARVAPFLGQADISQGDIIPLSTERKDARTIGPHTNAHFSIVVRKDSPYKSYQDLKGKKIGILGPATGQYQLVKVVTKLEGLDLEKDFQLNIGQPPVQIGWLLNREVEAIHLFESHTSKLLVSDGDKVRELYWLNDLYKKHSGSPYTYAGIYTSEDWIKKNTAVAKQVSLAWDDLMSYIYGHDEVWKGDVAKKLWKIEDPRVLELLVQRMPAVVEHPRYGPALKAAMIKRVQFMADAGLVSKETLDWYKTTFYFADE